MRTAHFMLGTILIGVLVEGAWATGHSLVDPASPPACAPDGTCYPKRETWGYYSSRWRSWPSELRGADVEPRPDELLRPDLRPYITPPPVEEDLASPPPTQQRPPVRPIAPPPQETTPETPSTPQTAPPPQTAPLQTSPTPLPETDNETDSPPSVPFQFPDLPDPGATPDADVTPEVTPPQSDDLFDLQSFSEGQQALEKTPERLPPPATDDPPPLLPSRLEQSSNDAPLSVPAAGTAPPMRSIGVASGGRQWRQFDPGVIPAGYASSAPPRMHGRSIVPQVVQAEHTKVANSPPKAESEPTPFFSWSKMFGGTR